MLVFPKKGASEPHRGRGRTVWLSLVAHALSSVSGRARSDDVSGGDGVYAGARNRLVLIC